MLISLASQFRSRRAYVKGGMFPFNGWIQDVAFYSPQLSDTDVQNNFSLGNTPPG